MKIGITYDLRDDYLAAGYGEEETAEFDRPGTVEAIDDALCQLGYETDRIGNCFNLVQRLASGEKWDLVFNIAEGLNGLGREGMVPSLLDAYRIPYTFSDPLVLALTLHKGMAKRVVRDLGFLTPDFFIVDRYQTEVATKLPYPLFAKPIAEGTSKGITAASKIKTPKELTDICNTLLTKFNQPVLVETFLPGREFTVGIVGTGDNARVIGNIEVILKENAEQDVYTYTNKENCENLVEYQYAVDWAAQKTEEMALGIWCRLGCRDAGRVDIRIDGNGMPSFIELNPLAGLHPEHSDLCIIASKIGISYLSLIESIISSAFERYLLVNDGIKVTHG